jgi:hypothetical protein
MTIGRDATVESAAGAVPVEPIFNQRQRRERTADGLRGFPRSTAGFSRQPGGEQRAMKRSISAIARSSPAAPKLLGAIV